jgi:hypothetical protein
MTAWLFDIGEASGDLAYPAIATSALWPGAATRGPGASLVSPNGRTLRYGFVGAAAGTGPCQAEYTANVIESPAAVQVVIVPHYGAANPSTICDAIGYGRSVTIHLRSPLASRLVVDQKGEAVEVIPAG